MNGSASSFFNGPLFRSRSSSEENTHHNVNVRCAAYAGSEFGDAHCGLVTEMPHTSLSQSSEPQIDDDMYDFYGEDDDSVLNGITSPKRMRVVPCSPPLPTVIVSEDTLPCVTRSATVHSISNCVNNAHHVDHYDSSPFPSTSLLVTPPPFASSTSTSVPIYRPLIGLTSPF